MRLALCLSLGLVVAAAGCGPFGKEPPFLSDRQWRDLTAGRLPPDVQPMSLTVIGAEGRASGRQLIAFEFDLRGKSPAPTVPLSCEHRITVAGIGSRDTGHENRYAPLMAEVLYRASGGNAQARLRIGGMLIAAQWLPPDPEKPAKPSDESWPGEFRSVRIADGVLHGELELDRAAILADLNKGFAARDKAHPGLKLEAQAVLVIRLDNRGLRDALPKQSSHVLVGAWGLVPDWHRWSYPEKGQSGNAP